MNNQSPPYLIEAIRQIEQSQQNAADSRIVNYSTILSLDANTNQLVNLTPALILFNNNNNNPAADESKRVANVHSDAIITESEPSASRLDSLLNNNNHNYENSSSKVSSQNLPAKPPARALPVTSSHLKRPPFPTSMIDSGEASGPNEESSSRQNSSLGGPTTANDLHQQNNTANRGTNNQSSYLAKRSNSSSSLVSPSVISDEALGSQALVRLSDLAASDRRLSHAYPEEPSEQEVSSSMINGPSNPRVIYSRAPLNRAANKQQRINNTNNNDNQFRAVGAGNQLTSSSASSTLNHLETSRSTDLSPLSSVEHGGGNPESGAVASSGADEAAMSEEEAVAASNDNLFPESGTSAGDNAERAPSINNSELNQLVRERGQIEQANQWSPLVNQSYSRYAEENGYSHHRHHNHSTPTDEQEPGRVLEIPEKILVSAPDLQPSDPIPLTSIPEAPIRLVVNKTRFGKLDARCPKEGVTSFEHPSACDKYYYCDDGYLIEQTCPNGLMYGLMHRIKDYCVYRWHADCVDKTIPNPISSPGCRWQYGVFSVQGSPKCTPDYYECVAGRFEVKKCQVIGQVYDDRTKGCQFAEKVGCPEEIISDFQCPSDDRSNSFWPFPRYYLDEKTIIHCVNDKPKIMRCPERERVDLEHLYCIPVGSKEPVVMDRKVRERQKGTMPQRQ